MTFGPSRLLIPEELQTVLQTGSALQQGALQLKDPVLQLSKCAHALTRVTEQS